MNDFRTLLDQVAERADVDGLPAPSEIRAAGTRRTRRTAVACALAAVALVAGTLVTVTAVGRNQAQEPAEHPDRGPLPVPTETTGDPRPNGRGTPEPLPEDGLRVASVAPFGDGFAAVVWDTKVPVGYQTYQLATQVWTFRDGRWQPPPDSSRLPDGDYTNIVPFRGGLAVTGFEPDVGPAIWYSTDAVSWHRLSVERADLTFPEWIDGIARTEAGWVAWGHKDEAWGNTDGWFVPRMWTSTDGRSWRHVRDDAQLDSNHTELICWVEQVDGGYVAVGTHARYGGEPQTTPRVFASTDLQTWRRQPTQGLPADLCRRRWDDPRLATGPAGTMRTRDLDKASWWPADD